MLRNLPKRHFQNMEVTVRDLEVRVQREHPVGATLHGPPSHSGGKREHLVMAALVESRNLPFQSFPTHCRLAAGRSKPQLAE